MIKIQKRRKENLEEIKILILKGSQTKTQKVRKNKERSQKLV